jgi:hypothetical protein
MTEVNSCEPEIEDDEEPPYLWYTPLMDLLRDHTAETLPRQGHQILFDVEGFDRSQLCLYIYVRPHATRIGLHNFPLVNIRLEGPGKDTLRGTRSDRTGGRLYGTGAFRSLIQYLEAELPKRGFKGIFLEHVQNGRLRKVAERYGFKPIGNPQDLDFVKELAA